MEETAAVEALEAEAEKLIGRPADEETGGKQLAALSGHAHLDQRTRI